MKAQADEYGIDATNATIQKEQSDYTKAVKNYDDAMAFVVHWSSCLESASASYNEAMAVSTEYDTLKATVDQYKIQQADNATPNEALAQLITEGDAKLAELAQKNEQEDILRQANKKRSTIILLSFATVVAALIVKNERFSILLMSACMIASLMILYRNLALLTVLSTDDLRLRTLRLTTIFDLTILITTLTIVVLVQADSINLSSISEKWIAACIVSIVMLFGGYISPKLPFNRHTGLRSPWTIRDEETWNIAHRIIGYISIPCVLLILAANMTIPSLDKGKHAFQRQKSPLVCVIVLGGRQPTFVLFLARGDFCSPESPSEFCGRTNAFR